jgi:hypothetical protein
MATVTVDLGFGDGVRELRDWVVDGELTAIVDACIEAQRKGGAAVLETSFTPAPAAEALAAVSEGALRAILAAGRDVHGIARERGISNVIAFNTRNVADAVWSREVMALRRSIDAKVTAKLHALTQDPTLTVVASGHFWYPPGAYMGWHTNSHAPGIRIYVSQAQEPGRSFFRYRDPDTDRVITAHDDRWNVRVFRVGGEKPLWHAVYSETHRFSLGYLVLRKRPGDRLRRVLRRILH